MTTPRRGRPPIALDTPQGVLDELARLYRDARHGRLQIDRATRLAYLLSLMLKGHQVVALERRVAALENPPDEPPYYDPDPDI